VHAQHGRDMPNTPVVLGARPEPNMLGFRQRASIYFSSLIGPSPTLS